MEQFYDADPRREWDRHERIPFEFEVTMRYIQRLLAPRDSVLDLGGGPGRYAFALKRAGHPVTLADLSGANLAFAKQKAPELGLDLNGYVKADARDLSAFRDEGFDAIVALGPFYHLQDEGDRRLAVSECLRVLKPGGLLAVGFISIYAAIYDAAVREPAKIAAWRPRLLQFIQTGMFQSNSGACTEAWFVDPYKIEAFFSSFPVEKLHLIGAESMVAQSKYLLGTQPPDILRQWIDFAADTAETDAALGGSEHLVYFGRKAAR